MDWWERINKNKMLCVSVQRFRLEQCFEFNISLRCFILFRFQRFGVGDSANENEL